MSKRTNTPARLLVVDRDIRYGEWLRHHLGVLCPEAAISVLNVTEFERWIEEIVGREFDILMLGASFGSSPEDPEALGLQMLRHLRERPRFPVVIAVAEEGNELTAVRALQLGAIDYLPKRLLTPERLGTSIKLALRRIEKLAARRLAEIGPSPAAGAKVAQTDARPAASAKAPEDEARPAASAKPPEDEARSPASAKPVEAEAKPAANAKPAQADAKPVEADTTPPARAGDAAITAGNLALAEPAIATHSAFFPYGVDFVASEVLQEDAWQPSTPAAPVEAAAHASPAPKSDQDTDTPQSSAANSSDDSAKESAAAEASPADDAGTQEPLPVAPDFLPGYTIHATVGESEKATVYVATSATLGHKVALKVSKTLRDEVAGRQFLEREYTAIVAIRNPYVVQIYDYGVHAGYEYLVMEYLPRGDLKARMQQRVTEQEALWYVEQIAQGLRVVHHAGLLHRDLKPPNVMLRENGDVALIDFGLARALDGSTPSTRIGVLRGSPYYMSPEQALGEQLDARSDFYSLGIIFYEMLTGRKPYTGGSAMEVLQQHVNAPVPQLPKGLAQHTPLLGKLLAKSREERFSSASELIAALVTAREIGQVESSAA